MTIHNEADLEAAIAALSERVRREIELVDAQITKSRAARGYVPTEGTPGKPGNPLSPAKSTAKASDTVTSPALAFADPASTAASSAAASSSGAPQQKSGPLLNFGRPRMLQSFKPSYFVVDAAKGFMWWDSADAFRRNPTSPNDTIPFYEITSNSRASKFKKAVTCWPLILPEDCSKATDSTMFYFGLEYVNPKASSGKTELLVLGAASESEKNEWVTYITTYVKLFLANRMESEAFLEFPVGSKTPTHVSAVLDGEAPR